LNFIEFNINGQKFITREDISIIETCKFTGIQIPRFCYQEGLAVAGNCRMCLVHLELSDKLVIACLTDIESELEISTNNLVVKKARENIIETLLLNHPLDCPICDQAGECDLQDQTKNYGSFYNKMHLKRRGVEDKSFNFFIKTIMTRCIHCTRCVRFSGDILGVETLGTLMRGNATEIGLYGNTYLSSEMAGNLIDLCPVGALTARTHAFKTRPWELKSIETIDLTDSLSNNIFVNYKESEIIRILPKPNDINGNLISDKSRFSFDSLYANRIVNSKKSIKFFETKVNSFAKKYKNSGSKNKILVLINEQLDLKLINQLKFIASINRKIKIKIINRFKEFKNINFFVNDSVITFDENNNNCSVLLGCNNKVENEIINTKIRIKTLVQDYCVYLNNYKYSSKNENVAVNLSNNEIFLLLEGKNKSLAKFLIEEKSPQFIISENFKKRYSNIFCLKIFLKNLNTKIDCFTINAFSNTESNFFLGLKSINSRDLDLQNAFLFVNLNENITLKKIAKKTNKNIILFNTHHTSLAKGKDISLPFSSYCFEKNGTYLNIEQRFQKSRKILKSVDQFNYLVNFLRKDKKFPAFKYLTFIKKESIGKDSFSFIETDSVEIYNHTSSLQETKILNSFFNRSFSHSFSKYLLQAQKNLIHKYPIKSYFQDQSKKDLFCGNSHALLTETILKRFRNL